MLAMDHPEDDQSPKRARHVRCRVAAIGTGSVVAAVGAWYLGAWLFGLMTEHGITSMTLKTNTALGLLLAGLALVLLVPERTGPARRWLGRLCATIVFVLGALTLSEHLIGWDLGIDQLLAKEPPGAAGVFSPNRMGPPASLSFVLAGLALLVLSRDKRRTSVQAQCLALGVCLIASLGVLGYLYDVQQLYALVHYTAIAWPTAVTLLLLGVGLLCARPNEGLMRLVTADDPGGVLVRRVLLPSLLLVVLLGWLRLYGEQRGLYDTAMGTGLLVFSFLGCFTGLLYYAGIRLSQTAMAERAAAEQLRKIAQFPEENPNPVLRVSHDGRVLYANPVALKELASLGWRADQFVPAPFGELARHALQAGGTIDQEIPCAACKTLVFSVTPIAGAGYVNLYGRDVTAQKRVEADLRESELFFRQMLESIPGMVFTTRPDGYCDYQSQPWVDYTGVPMSEHLGDGWNRLLHPDDQPRAYAAWEAAVEGHAPYDLEYRVRRHDGQYEWFKVIGRPISDAAGKIVRWFGVALNIEDLKRVEEALKAARDSAERAKAVAEQANRAKDHFLAVLSHELRTPLTPVVMGVSMLQDRPDLAPQVRETLEMVRRNVEMEARLIDDLLDVTRIARGKIELNRSPVELCTVIQRAVEVCKPDIEARGLHFGVDLGPCAPYWVDADVPRLQQVFWNLLKNAIKFTPHGGCVGIRCQPNERYVVAEVSDSGIGIEQESLSRVFNAFEQGERSITRQFGGLGLGLAISKALVELHGGEIEAYSDGRDKGATFRLRLPLTARAGQPSPPPPTVPAQRVVRPLRILLVEDHGVTAKMMRMVLTAEGHSVEMAGDVATAMELADHHAFDLLLSDLGLPDGSGHDLLHRLRERGHRFPGIALSGYGQEEDVRRSYEAGFATHLTKPASREAVVEAVAAVTVKWE